MARSLLAVVVVSAGMAVCGATLKVPLKTGEVVADGEDLCYVNVCVNDADGLVVPTACPVVEFAVEGPAEIVATDNGDETDFDDFRCARRKAFNGWVQAIVRPKVGAKGAVRVSVRSESLEGTSVTFTAK